MKPLFDLLPVVLFILAYKFYDFYVATYTIMIATVLQVFIHWLIHRSFERMHIIMLAVVLGLGSLTLIFHNELFFKWKPTAVSWVMAIIFLFSRYVTQKPLVQHILEEKISLPDNIWLRLNYSWVFFFLLTGGLNLFVVYNYSTDIWVYFKLGLLGLSLFFAICQGLYLHRHADLDE